MEVPVKIDKLSAKQIAWLITRKSRRKKTRHLLQDRLDHLEKSAGHPLRDDEKIRQFFEEFLVGADLFFSFLYLSPKISIPQNVYAIGTKRIEKYLEEAKIALLEANRNLRGFRIPLWLLRPTLSRDPIYETMYAYCLNGVNTLVLVATIKGKLAPEHWDDSWFMSFDFSGVTFLNFEDTASYIRDSINNERRLRHYSEMMSILFPVFVEQADQAEQHFQEEEMDSRALASLSEFENKLLGIYLPVFNGYGEADPRILVKCDLIQTDYETRDPSGRYWVIYSPSYCLPVWFILFFNSLDGEDRLFLERLDPNKRTEDEILRIVNLLETFEASIS